MAKGEVEMCAVYGVIFMFVNAFGTWFGDGDDFNAGGS
jgi:hypothetical protein